LDSLHDDDAEAFSFFQYCNIDNLLNISNKLAKLEDFTLGKKRITQIFPNILSKTQQIR
jgi:hypothetical protein